jgi:hypothetical protein
MVKEVVAMVVVEMARGLKGGGGLVAAAGMVEVAWAVAD